MYLGFKLSTPSDVSFTNPMGWTRQFGGNWFEFINKMVKEYPNVEGIYLHNSFGCHYGGANIAKTDMDYQSSLFRKVGIEVLSKLYDIYEGPVEFYSPKKKYNKNSAVIVHGSLTLQQAQFAIENIKENPIILANKFYKYTNMEPAGDWDQLPNAILFTKESSND